MKNEAFLLFTQLATVKGNERRDRPGSQFCRDAHPGIAASQLAICDRVETWQSTSIWCPECPDEPSHLFWLSNSNSRN